ncbi:hypothetical protein DE146DRAFT_740061 [Phaeosphaeria sp. MPI-PUGE-AT-0046c]|nr:hypothetical protein DE146DRAFT_740061 [Phaeosphaeria sp. MPI-PUGE-AT-0046c]
MVSLLSLLAFASAIKAISLWEPTGPYHVGYMQEILNHTTPNDPTSPGTFILITIYYPTVQVPNTTTPYLDPISASIFESTIGEAPYLPLPTNVNNTKGVYGYPDFTNFPPMLQDGFAVLNYRVSDIQAAMDNDYFLAFVQQKGLPFNTTHLGIFGHSLGGAAAAAVMSSNETNAARYKVGSNLDGGYYQFIDETGRPTFDVPAPDLQRPFLELAAENHFEGNLSDEPTWKFFDDAQTGWLRDVQINGTRHLDFSDIPLWIDLLDQRAVLNRTWIGPANGVRVTHLANTMLKRSFGSISGFGLRGVDEWIDEIPEFFVVTERGL